MGKGKDFSGIEREVKLSVRHTVVMRELNARQSMIADEYVGAVLSQTRAHKVYALCSVHTLNGRQVLPLEDQAEYDRLAEAFNMAETAELVKAFQDIYSAVASANDPKPSPAAPSSEK